MRIFKNLIEWLRFDNWESTSEYIFRVIVPITLLLSIIIACIVYFS